MIVGLAAEHDFPGFLGLAAQVEHWFGPMVEQPGRWLVVSEQARGQGVGRALTADAMRRFVRGPGSIEMVTFGAV
ncbi:hypothetical protein [Nonomuraea maritima]|uniref:hypothetical protein n=1 Tax=Nonomuraea maritima TaxID=683260 RepID=UPI001C40A388|nr:hypothetical protein [Nonomuraea maritima]